MEKPILENVIIGQVQYAKSFLLFCNSSTNEAHTIILVVIKGQRSSIRNTEVGVA